MPPNAQPQSSQPAARRGVDPGDVNVMGVVFFVIGLAVAIALVHVAVATLFFKLKRSATTEDREIARREVMPSVAAARAYFPAPHEQIAAELDLQAWRAEQETELNSYGWIDRKAGVVRIPIDRAMELVSERGLPTRKGSNAPLAGESSVQLQQERPVQSSPPEKEEGRKK